MKIGVVCYPTYGGSGVVATELGKALAGKGHKVHFVAYEQPARLHHFFENRLSKIRLQGVRQKLDPLPSQI